MLPYAPHTGAMFVDMIGLDGNPAPVCQRSFLKRMCDRLAERGLRIEISFENEFSLARAGDGGYEPVDSSLCFSTIGMTAVAGRDRRPRRPRSRRSRSCSSSTTPSWGTASTRSRPATPRRSPAVDEQIFTRETIRAIATAHGLVASLAPKPWPQNAGNGCHIHFSLWEGDANRFHDPDGPGSLSAEARAFIAGLLEHLPGLCGLTAPSFNSYHRIIPHYWAGAFTCWGLDNREAPVRVPSLYAGREEASTNAELKAADASCNPYLAVGGLIAAGPRRDRARPRAARAGAGRPGDAARRPSATAKGIRPLPSSQREALDALAADAVLTGAMGEVLAGSYLAVRRSEWDVYSSADEAFEQQGHFEKY